MADIKAGQWYDQRAIPARGLVGGLKSPGIAKVARVFVQNAEPLRRLPMFPSIAFVSGWRYGVADACVRLELFGDPHGRPANDRQARELERRTEEHARRGHPPRPGMMSMEIWTYSNPSDVYNAIDRQGKTYYESLMQMQVVASWTLFETLAGDLWEKAVNARPNPLARLDGVVNRITDLAGDKVKKPGRKKTRPDESDGGRPAGLTSGLLLDFTRGTLNVKTRMGTLLREAEEVTFNSLPKIRVAYSRAFKDNSARIDGVLADPALDMLSAVRNCLVHRGGVADQEFVDKAAYLSGLPQLDKGKRIRLDGAFVNSLVTPVVECGERLIRAVDGRVAAIT